MQRGTEVCTCTLTFAQGSRSICSAIANGEPRRKSSLVSQSLQNRFGKAADRRSRSVKHLSTPSLQNATQKEEGKNRLPRRIPQTFGAEVAKSHRPDSHRRQDNTAARSQRRR